MSTKNLEAPLSVDVQAQAPEVRLSLSRVGVTGVEKIIRIGTGAGEQLFYAELECYVDLGPAQMGVHMSRFEEVINEAVDEVVIGEAFRAETLAAHIAERVRDRQDGSRAEVTIRARFPEHKRTPLAKARTQELYWMIGTAVAGADSNRCLVGVEAQGMTACPCAQSLVQERSRGRLIEDGFGEQEIERIFAAVPTATHNQRGIGTLYLGCQDADRGIVEARDLLEIVESSMSSEIYELMKRSDEAEVVEKAHLNPRFVEDCVREMVRQATERYGQFGADAFVLARQENLETIHQHHVVAERHGTMGELLDELRDGQQVQPHTTMRAWLEG